MNAPYLTLDLLLQRPGLTLDVQFQTSAPWTILFGPSGSGKSSILRAIAGFESGQRIKLTLNGRTLAGESPTVPPHLRGVTFVSQEAVLFPHRTVRQNVAYGAPKATESALNEILQQFHIQHAADRYPSSLSGGEQRRVALARSVAREGTTLLLLDEIFTGLDMPLRDELVAALLSWQARSGMPIFSVTHDIGEALLIGAEVLRLQDGRIVAQGPARAVLAVERQRQLRLLA